MRFKDFFLLEPEQKILINQVIYILNLHIRLFDQNILVNNFEGTVLRPERRTSHGVPPYVSIYFGKQKRHSNHE
jgi:hypothetical protein